MRGSIVDVYPSTDDHPVRIDLWGDEVDRLSAFSVADQRSTHDVDEVCIFPTRELLPDRRGARAGRARSSRSSRGAASSGSAWPRARCSTAWSRGCRGSRTSEHLLTDLLPDTALVLLVRAEAHARPRPGAARRRGLAGGDARGHVGRGRRARPAAALARLRPAARAHRRGCGVVAVDTRAPRHAAPRGDRVRPGGRRRRRAGAAAARARAATASASCSRRRATGSAQRLHDVLAGEGLDVAAGAPAPGAVRLVGRAARTRRRPPRRAARARRRGRPHRSPTRAPPARAARAAAQDYYDDARSRATTSCTTSTASVATWR